MGHKLIGEEPNVLLAVLKDYGCTYPRAVAKRLYREGYFIGESSAASYFSDVLRGVKPISERVTQGLLKMCENDERISFLNVQNARGQRTRSSEFSPLYNEQILKVNLGLLELRDYLRLKGYLSQVEGEFLSADEKEKKRIFRKLESMVK